MSMSRLSSFPIVQTIDFSPFAWGHKAVLSLACVGLALLGMSNAANAQLVGLWDFENAGDLTNATTGSDLVLTGFDAAVAGSGGSDTGAAALGDFAAGGGYYTVPNSIGATGGGTRTNTFSLLMDIQIPGGVTGFNALASFDDDLNPGSDSDYFLDTDTATQDRIGVGSQGYLNTTGLIGTDWHRIILNVENGVRSRSYLDGILLGNHNVGTIDGLWSLDGDFEVFFDGDLGEELLTNVSNLALFSAPVDASALGVAGDPISFVPAAAEVEVFIDRVTGEVSLENNTSQTVFLKGYSITSTDGALDATNAPFLADSDSNWVRLSAATGNDLSEGHLTTGSIAPGSTLNYGNDSWLQYYQEDVELKFLDSQGNTFSGIVTFTGDAGAGDVPFDFADLNFDTQIDLQDWNTFKANFGNDLTDMSVAQLYQNSDLDSDGVHTLSDFLEFERAFDTVNGVGALAAAIASVPEPSTLAMLCLGGVFAVGRRRRKHNTRSISMNTLSDESGDASGNTVRIAQPMVTSCLLAMVFCLLLSTVSRADVLVFSEDFEGLVLKDSVDEGNPATFDTGEVDGNGNPILLNAGTDATPGTEVWTDVAPAGWTIDRTGVPGYDADEFNNHVKEWIGWNFADKDWWNDIGGQDRDQFTRASGTVLVADNDEWEDASGPCCVTDPAGTGPWYNTTITTPAIDISGLPAGVVNLAFDSSWRDEFDSSYQQNVNITVSFDGGPATEVLRFDSDPGSPDFKAANLDEHVTVALDNPGGASTATITFGMFDAGNDWWWAIDNVAVLAVGPPLDLQVDKATGEMSLESGVLPSSLNSYNITSAAGALDAASWSAGNLTSQATGGGLSADLDGDGDVDGADFLKGQRDGAGASFFDTDFPAQYGQTGGSAPGDDWEVLNDTQNQLAEAILNGDDTSVGAFTGVSIGNGYDTTNGSEDLVFTYTSFGQVVTGTVSYINALAAGTAVPEPSSLALILLATVVGAGAGRRK